jgi:class 3 adenylate cyclase/phosphoglycerate-specific signal transduction histidine kinase
MRESTEKWSATTASAKRSVFGIGGKLIAAFGALSGGIVLASAVAWFVFTNIDHSVRRVTGESVPGMVTALRLAQMSAEISSTAPSIDASGTQEDRVREQAKLQDRQRRLETLIDDLGTSLAAPEQIATLSRLAGELDRELADLSRAVEARIAVAEEKRAAVARLSQAHSRFEELLEPLIDDSVFNLVISGEQVTAESTSMITALVEGGVGHVDGLLTIKAEGNLVMGLVAETVRLGDPALIEPLRERFIAAAAAIDRDLRQLSPSAEVTALQRAADALLAFGRGTRNVFDLREQHLRDAAADAGPARADWTAVNAALKASHETFLLQLTPMIDNAAFDLVLTTEEVTANSTNALTELIDVGANTLHLLLTLEAEGNLAAGLLNEAAATSDLSHLQPLHERFIAARSHIERSMRQLPADALARGLDEVVTRLIDFGIASDSIFALRRQEIEHAATAHAALETGRQLAAALGAEIAMVVGAAERMSVAVADQALSAISSGKISLLVISFAGLLCATAAMLAFVRPQLIQPLENITAAMTRLAGGDTSADVPYRDRSDEIGRMAQALGVFRDTAIEVQRTSLREIETARRRLADAIESISEAFSLYDSEDRLVVCNEKYRTLLYPGIAEEIAPGMSFEEIVRRAAELGYIKDADGRVEKWLADRVAQHRDPGEPHLQQRADGRWIMVSEHGTAEGGTVAVYSDITELKRREEELATKSNALEQLSNQLAKYLAPQVYESIFSGRQEVKLTSRRRKLTVFFSDIAGFTETADRLESEELTELLNHYLTEMSQIALVHGATIDKYVGDAIVIFFGDPETRGVKEDALACVKMAIAMQARMRELETIWRDAGIEKPLRCRMGINTGFCTVGNFGSEDRMDYTIIGGGVNLASRLESAAMPGDILVSYETYALVKDEIRCEERGKIEVKGIAYPVEAFAVIDAHESPDHELRVIREQRRNLKLEIDLEAMTANEREEGAAVLRSVLHRLSGRE